MNRPSCLGLATDGVDCLKGADPLNRFADLGIVVAAVVVVVVAEVNALSSGFVRIDTSP